MTRSVTAQASIPIILPACLQEEANRNKLGDLLIFSHHPDSKEETFCMSTLPSHFATVTHCNSRCVQQPPPPPLPHGELGFLPQVSHLMRMSCSSLAEGKISCNWICMPDEK